MSISPRSADDRLIGATVALARDQRSFDSVDGPDAFTSLTTVPAGTLVEIVAIESHGVNPWRRWTAEVTLDLEAHARPVRRLHGLVEGLDF